MQNQMRERQTAMQIAWTREFLKYFGTFFGLAAVGLTAGYEICFLTENINILHLYFNDDASSCCIIMGTENILDTQSTLLELPKGPLTYEDLEKIRRSQSKFFIQK
ncbi:PLRKT protein, partial [Podilymbus podiceps]|nr:PLRKT protein [Podilymbus podiceps]